jgi:hypothetical protein
MNYKNALNKLNSCNIRKQSNRLNIKNLPKGWVILRNNGTIEDTLTQEERETFDNNLENIKRKNILNNLTNNFIKYKKEEFYKEGYTFEQIDILIEEMFETTDDEEDENSRNEDSDSNGENDYYSDEY